LARPNWKEYKWERRQVDYSLVNVLIKSKGLPTTKGFNLIYSYQLIGLESEYTYDINRVPNVNYFDCLSP